MPDAARDRSKAIGMFPCGFGAELQFFYAQPGGAKNDVLSVIQFPVPSQDAVFGLEPPVKRGVRKRSHYREPWQVNAGLNCELCRFQKDIRRVVVEAEHEAPLKRNAMLVEPLDHSNKFVG